MPTITELWTFLQIRLPDGSITRDAQVAGGTDLARTKMAQEASAVFPLDLTKARVWDALTTDLPTSRAAATADDLAFITGTLGSSESPAIHSEDKASNLAVETQYAAWLKELPLEYEAAETVTIRISAAMQTVADVSAVLDVDVYKIDRENGVGSQLVVAGDADQSINGGTAFADYDFEVTATSLSAGDVLLIRVSVAIRDDATGSNVYAKIGAAELLADSRG